MGLSPPRTEYATLDRLFAGDDLSRVVARGWYFYAVDVREVPLDLDYWRTHASRTRIRIPNLQDTAPATPERPVVTIVSPTPGGPIGPTEAFIFTVTCSEEIALQRFNVRTGGPGSAWEVNYRDGEVSPGARVTRTEIPDGLRFEVRRDGAWVGTRIDFEPVFGTATAVAATNE